MLSPDKFHDECAVFGIYGHKEASNLTYLGLYALQHRGQEASGIVSSDGEHFHMEKGMGLVADIFSSRELSRLPGEKAIARIEDARLLGMLGHARGLQHVADTVRKPR